MRPPTGLVKLLALSLLPASTASAHAQPPPPAFSEAVVVTEASLILRAPQRGIAPQELTVVEAGVARKVTQIEALAGDWSVLVYIDVPLSDHRTLVAGTRALAAAADALVARGPVRVVVADPAPGERLAPSRDATQLRQVLLAVGEEPMGPHSLVLLRGGLDQALGEPTADLQRIAAQALNGEVRLVRRQTDRLLATIAAAPAGQAGALFLVSDGFEEDPRPFYSRASGLRPPPGSDLSPLASGLGPALAAYGWVTLTLALRDRAPEAPPQEPTSTLDAWQRDLLRPGEEGVLARGRLPAARPVLEALDLLLLPMAAPLRSAAEESGGLFLRTAAQLRSAVAGLADSVRLWYETPRPLAGGPLLPVSVRLAKDGSDLPSPRWVRTETPELVLAARGRGLIEGWGQPGRLPLAVEVVDRRSAPATQTMRLRVSVAAELPVTYRIAVVHADDGGGMATQVLAGAGEAGRARLVEVLLPAEAKRVAVLATSTGDEAWGGAVVEIPRD